MYGLINPAQIFAKLPTTKAEPASPTKQLVMNELLTILLPKE